ncbi:hypothetical protein ES703_101784 [subsurface metagenome]
MPWWIGASKREIKSYIGCGIQLTGLRLTLALLEPGLGQCPLITGSPVKTLNTALI